MHILLILQTASILLILNLSALSELAHMHRTYIGMIERAEKNITLTNIEKLSKALGVEIKDLF